MTAPARTPPGRADDDLDEMVRLIHRIVDRRLERRTPVAPPLEALRGTFVETVAGTRTAKVLVDGSSTAAPAILPMLPEIPVAGDELLLLRRRDGWLVITDVLGRDVTPATASSGGEAFPVGAVFIAVVGTDPATLLGYGTWVAFGAGRVLVGLSAGDPDFDTAEETGGAKTVPAAGSNATEAAHTHGVGSYAGAASGTGATGASQVNGTDDVQMNNPGGTALNITKRSHTHTGPSHQHTMSGTSGAGSSHGHAFTGSPTSVVQPYVVVYMWKRTA